MTSIATPSTNSLTNPAGGTSSSNLSDWSGEYVTDMLGRAQAIANEPYQVYGGPQVAGESALQSKVFQGLGNLNFPSILGQNFTSAGAPTIGANGQPVGGGTSPAAQYMNPYLQSVLNPQLAEMRRQNEITNMGANAKFTGAGAFGGGRQAIANAENNRNMMQEQNKAIGQGYANAYDKAMGQFNTEQGQARTLADMMSDQGAQQRNIEQQGISADYNEFLAQREDPMKKTQFLQSMVQGLPIATTTNTAAQPTGLGSLVSSVGGMGSIMDSLKKFNLTGGST